MNSLNFILVVNYHCWVCCVLPYFIKTSVFKTMPLMFGMVGNMNLEQDSASNYLHHYISKDVLFYHKTTRTVVSVTGSTAYDI